jgi:beta-ureidopropionase / N-carbamoyl-L-amino-acid hydrolase
MHRTLSPASAAPDLAAPAALQVDGARLWHRLMELARIGATDKGGVCRVALTDADRQGRALFAQWARELGCTLRMDAIGNLFARRAGLQDDLPAVATGSHLDTQPTGGKFDGNYGVLAGLEVLATLQDAGLRTRAPLEVCVWTNEEGSRFVPVMMGSGVYAGAFTLAHALAATDAQGTCVADALQAIGQAGTAPASVDDGAPRFGAYFEAHIEQGPVLEDAGITIGAVSGALGQRWYDVTVTGLEAHAGPTPMGLRRDALLPAAALVQRVNEIALAEQPHGRGTVGSVSVFPNSRNTIPGRVGFTVDFRHTDDAGLLRNDLARHLHHAHPRRGAGPHARHARADRGAAGHLPLHHRPVLGPGAERPARRPRGGRDARRLRGQGEDRAGPALARAEHALREPAERPHHGRGRREGRRAGGVHREMLPRGPNPRGTCAMIPQFGALSAPTLTALLADRPARDRAQDRRRRARRVLEQARHLPYRPHIGTLSCSPEIDSINTLTPDSHGGNMDLPDMGPGSITYLPVRTEGARLFIGDAHACQGDGEVCGTAVEFPSTTTIQVDLIKGWSSSGRGWRTRP